MATYTFTPTSDAEFTAAEREAGITFARERHNANDLPRDEETGQPIGAIETDQDYVQWVMDHAAASYARDKAMEEE